MDWSKTKSIFIGVFLILNVFLYSQYIEIYNGKNLEKKPGEEDAEAQLQSENITYDKLPNAVETAFFLSAQVKTYSPGDFPTNDNQQFQLLNDNQLVVNFKTPIKLSNTKEPSALQEFVNQYVYEGKSFVLWEIDEETRTATFFQSVNNGTVYYNEKGGLQLHWNTKGEVYMYKQAMLEKIEKVGRPRTIVPPLQVLKGLYNQKILKTDYHITSMQLGYATHVQFTEKQVLTPTWEVHVKTDKGNEQIHFVNANTGTVMDLQRKTQEVGEE